MLKLQATLNSETYAILICAFFLHSELVQINFWIVAYFSISKTSTVTKTQLAFHIWLNYSKFTVCWVVSGMLYYKKQIDVTKVTQATSQYSPVLESRPQAIPAIWQLFMREHYWVEMQGDFWTTNKSHDELVNRPKAEEYNSIAKSHYQMIHLPPTKAVTLFTTNSISK